MINCNTPYFESAQVFPGSRDPAIPVHPPKIDRKHPGHCERGDIEVTNGWKCEVADCSAP